LLAFHIPPVDVVVLSQGENRLKSSKKQPFLLKFSHMKFKKTVLDNGLRILTIPMKDTQSAIGMVLVEAGSDYESKEINGLSHFLEHMCFKGTDNRNIIEIKEELDGMGASANAFTGNEYTGYYAKTHFKKIDKVIDLVSDLYLNPIFPEGDIDIERGVIIEEINMYEDLPQRSVYEVFEKLLYGDTPEGRTIIGPKKNIRSLKRDDFVKYHETHYVPGKTVVVVAGNINEAEVRKQVKKTFGQIKKGKVVRKKKIQESQKTPRVEIKNKKTDQTHIILGFRSFDLHNKKNNALKVAQTILGQGFSSRLFTRMRDELGMCYYAKAHNDTYSDRGSFFVATGVGNKRALEAVEVVMEEFKKLRDEEISDAEIRKAKEFIAGQVATSLETSDELADFFGFQELMREEIIKPSEKLKKIKAVKKEEIKKVLKEIMKPENLNLALIGPFTKKDEMKFKKLLKI
jgi:predicted Zn-dependent peptidase